MGYCKQCPGKCAITEYLHSIDIPEEVQYMQWVTTDRTALLKVSQSVNEYIDSLADQVHKLTRHSYVAKSQSEYMNFLKDNIAKEEMIIQGDFAENSSFVVQDEIQSFHWENLQATLHPFVLYYRDDDGQLCHKSFCINSDVPDHNTTTVWTFLEALLQQVKIQHPSVGKIHYFTDGCGGQYKNN